MSRKWMYVIAAAVGVAAVAVLVGVSLVGGKSSSRPRRPRPWRWAPKTAALLAGIPQHGDTLGSPKAPVTLVEYADMQCPYCGEFARTTLPTLIRDYVRTGKVKIVFHGLEFVGPDSDTALRAVYAAGRQNKLWSYSPPDVREPGHREHRLGDRGPDQGGRRQRCPGSTSRRCCPPGARPRRHGRDRGRRPARAGRRRRRTRPGSRSARPAGRRRRSTSPPSTPRSSPRRSTGSSVRERPRACGPPSPRSRSSASGSRAT